MDKNTTADFKYREPPFFNQQRDCLTRYHPKSCGLGL